MGALILPERHGELASRLRFLQNAIGSVPSAFDCWLAQRGAKTLQLRMRQHGINALRIARYLKSRIGKEVDEVIYPGLEDHPRNELAYESLSVDAQQWISSLGEKDKEGGFPYGGMVSFRIHVPENSHSAGDEKAHATAEKFLTSLRLFTLAESLGGVESLAELPSLMTHGSIPPAERALLGIGDNLIRLSVGIEDGDDLVKDVEQALQTAVFGTVVKSKSLKHTNGTRVNGLDTKKADTPPLNA